MDRYLQEVTDEAHMRMLMQREVQLTEHPRHFYQESVERFCSGIQQSSRMTDTSHSFL
jgi:hypothetical protein